MEIRDIFTRFPMSESKPVNSSGENSKSEKAQNEAKKLSPGQNDSYDLDLVITQKVSSVPHRVTTGDTCGGTYGGTCGGSCGCSDTCTCQGTYGCNQ